MSAKGMEKAEEQGLIDFFKLTTKLTTSNMICFDFEGKIKKYDSPEEIIEDFYPVRLAYYQKRKVIHIPSFFFLLLLTMMLFRTTSPKNYKTLSIKSATRRDSSR